MYDYIYAPEVFHDLGQSSGEGVHTEGLRFDDKNLIVSVEW